MFHLFLALTTTRVSPPPPPAAGRQSVQQVELPFRLSLAPPPLCVYVLWILCQLGMLSRWRENENVTQLEAHSKKKSLFFTCFKFLKRTRQV